jgi:hypothetical protein
VVILPHLSDLGLRKSKRCDLLGRVAEAGRGRARTQGHRGHRLPRGPRRRHRRPAAAAAAAPRARGRPSRPAHRAALRTGTRPGLHPPGVGQRLDSGRQHPGAGVAPPRTRGSRRPTTAPACPAPPRTSCSSLPRAKASARTTTSRSRSPRPSSTPGCPTWRPAARSRPNRASTPRSRKSSTHDRQRREAEAPHPPSPGRRSCPRRQQGRECSSAARRAHPRADIGRTGSRAAPERCPRRDRSAPRGRRRSPRAAGAGPGQAFSRASHLPDTAPTAGRVGRRRRS